MRGKLSVERGERGFVTSDRQHPTHWQKQTANAQTEETSADLGDSAIVELTDVLTEKPPRRNLGEGNSLPVLGNGDLRVRRPSLGSGVDSPE